MNLFYSMEGSWSLFQSPIWISVWQIEYSSSLMASEEQKKFNQKQHNKNPPKSIHSPSLAAKWTKDPRQSEPARVAATITPL